MTLSRTAAIVCGFALMWACERPVDRESTLVLRGATVIDGTGSPPLLDATVVVDSGHISAIGPTDKVRVPSDSRIRDLRQKWIIPGMIDTHIHFNANGGAYDKPGDYDLRALRSYDDIRASILARIPRTLSRYTCAGVTSVLAVGDPRWQFDV